MTKNEFMQLVMPPNSRGCRMWTGPVDKAGYGRSYVNGVRGSAHRTAWALVHGDLPKGSPLLHTCMPGYDTGDMSYKLCCTVDHLQPATRADVVRHSAKAGRIGFPGERHHKAKLSDAQAERIRREYALGRTSYRDLADAYLVSSSTIGEIVRGARYVGCP